MNYPSLNIRRMAARCRGIAGLLLGILRESSSEVWTFRWGRVVWKSRWKWKRVLQQVHCTDEIIKKKHRGSRERVKERHEKFASLVCVGFVYISSQQLRYHYFDLHEHIISIQQTNILSYNDHFQSSRCISSNAGMNCQKRPFRSPRGAE